MHVIGFKWIEVLVFSSQWCIRSGKRPQSEGPIVSRLFQWVWAIPRYVCDRFKETSATSKCPNKMLISLYFLSIATWGNTLPEISSQDPFFTLSWVIQESVVMLVYWSAWSVSRCRRREQRWSARLCLGGAPLCAAGAHRSPNTCLRLNCAWRLVAYRVASGGDRRAWWTGSDGWFAGNTRYVECYDHCVYQRLGQEGWSACLSNRHQMKVTDQCVPERGPRWHWNLVWLVFALVFIVEPASYCNTAKKWHYRDVFTCLSINEAIKATN